MTGDGTHEKEKSGDKREMYRQRLICLGRTALIVLAGEPGQSLSELVRRNEREYPHGPPDRRLLTGAIHIGL